MVLLFRQHHCNGGNVFIETIVLVQLISQIFYMLGAPIHWCNLVSSTNVLVGYKEKRSVSSTMTSRLIIAYNLAVKSGNGIFFQMAAKST
jgi:hypothetical protein